MREFTFAMLTFNQEEFVIEHLESIKYQIVKYGDNYLINFLLCDDASQDCTVELVRKWINYNKKLFSTISIFASNENKGIVGNYTQALKSIKTKKFKILAGDDIYFKNNIFRAVEKSNFVISPLLQFANEKIVPYQQVIFNELLHNQNGNLNKILLKKIKYRMPLQTPGIFFDSTLVDEGLYDELKEYSWIEDVPQWNYLLRFKSTEVSLWAEPLVLYRVNIGISTNTAHSRNKEFSQDLMKLNKNIHTDLSRYPKCINPYRFGNWIRTKMYKYIINKKSKIIGDFEKQFLKEEYEGTKFLQMIKHNVKVWTDVNEY